MKSHKTIQIDPVLKDISKIKKGNRLFLHYYSLNKSLTEAIQQYAKGIVLDIGCGYKPYKSLFINNCSNHNSLP